jgi:hypothetical protein
MDQLTRDWSVPLSVSFVISGIPDLEMQATELDVLPRVKAV